MIRGEEIRHIQMCDIAAEVNNIQLHVCTYVETRVRAIVPNTSPGSSTAEKVTEMKRKPILEILNSSKKYEYERMMHDIKKIQERGDIYKRILGPYEIDPEYNLIIQAIRMSVDIDCILTLIYSYVQDTYSVRFPELKSLVRLPQQYIRTVRELGNNLERAKYNRALQQFLTPATIATISATASTTLGEMLTEEELRNIWEMCDIALELNSIKSHFNTYAETRTNVIAPNISFVLGSSTTAKVIGLAGGLKKLRDMSLDDLFNLGSQTNPSGYSTVAPLPLTGFIYNSNVVQNMPPEIRLKAYQMVVTKCSQAIEMDEKRMFSDGSLGWKLREEIGKELATLLRQMSPDFEVVQWTSTKMSHHQTTVRILYADMEKVIQKFKDKNDVIFVHCISGDFGAKRHMSAGAGLAFRKQIGRPKPRNCVNSHLAFQQASVGGAGIFSLITKPQYFQKPKKCDYDEAFKQLISALQGKGCKHLICSPLGCVRDRIYVTHFLNNLFDLIMMTGVSVSIVTNYEESQTVLWRGLPYQFFLQQLHDGIVKKFKKLEKTTTTRTNLR